MDTQRALIRGRRLFEARHLLEEIRYIKTSQLICRANQLANQLTGFYMIATLAFNELICESETTQPDYSTFFCGFLNKGVIGISILS